MADSRFTWLDIYKICSGQKIKLFHLKNIHFAAAPLPPSPTSYVRGWRKCENGALADCNWWGDNRSTRRKSYPTATLSTTNSIWTGLGSNPYLVQSNTWLRAVHLQVRSEDGHLMLPRRPHGTITWKIAVCVEKYVWEQNFEVDIWS